MSVRAPSRRTTRARDALGRPATRWPDRRGDYLPVMRLPVVVVLAACALGCASEQSRGGGGDALDAAIAAPPADAGDPELAAAGLALAVIETIDAIAIDHAILARWRAGGDEVRGLAEEHVVAFSAIGDDVRALRARRRELVPTDSAWTIALQESAWGHREAMTQARGEEFDRLWIAARVAAWARSTRLLDEHVIPSTTDPEVLEILAALRETLDATVPDATAREAQGRSMLVPVSAWSSCTALRTSSSSGCSNP